MAADLPADLPHCRPACWPAFETVCLPACPYVQSSTHLPSTHLHTYLSASRAACLPHGGMPAGLSACLPALRLACRLDSLPACLSAAFDAGLPVCLAERTLLCPHASWSTCRPSCLSAGLPGSRPACLPEAFLPGCFPGYLPEFRHAWLTSVLLGCILACLHSWRPAPLPSGLPGCLPACCFSASLLGVLPVSPYTRPPTLYIIVCLCLPVFRPPCQSSCLSSGRPAFQTVGLPSIRPTCFPAYPPL